MKKVLLSLIPILMLAGCGTSVQNENVEETNTKKNDIEITEEKEAEKEIVDMNMMDENAMFTHGEDVTFAPIYMMETDHLTSSNMFIDDLDAGSFAKYLVIGFVYYNQGKQELYADYTTLPKLYDGEGREFSADGEASLPVYIKKAVGEEILRPGIPTSLSAVYIVPKDATGFYFSAEDEGIEYRIHIRDNSADIE